MPWAGLLALAVALVGGPLCAEGSFFTLKGHGGPVKGVEVAPDGAILTASFDTAVGVWREGAAPLWLDGHRAAVNTVVGLSGGRVLSGGDDFDLRLWDLADGAVRVLPGHEGKILAIAVDGAGRRAASASWDMRIGLWSLDRPERAPVFLSGHGAGVNDVVFSADGRTLYSGASDGTLRIWDIAQAAETGQLVREVSGSTASR